MKRINIPLCLLLSLSMSTQFVYAQDEVKEEDLIEETTQEIIEETDDSNEKEEIEETEEAEDEKEEEEVEQENVTISTDPAVSIPLVNYGSIAAARAQYEKGSIGFFETIGATNSISILKSSTYTDNPEVNGVFDYKDATSLDNMVKVFDYIRQSNVYRSENGVSTLAITSELMAMAQSNANASTILRTNSGQYNVGENLSLGYEDPFSEWYPYEVEVYNYKKQHKDASDEEIAQALGIELRFVMTGHYENMIRNSYVITGYGICDYKESDFSFEDYTHVQTFKGNVEGFKEDGVYTLEDYEAMFFTYYNNILDQIEYSITFDGNGGSNVPSKMIVKANSSAQLSKESPTRKGYTFLGWSEDKNAKKGTYMPGDTFKMRDDMKLYAIWSINTYKVTFDANGGKVGTPSKNIVYNDPYDTLPEPVFSKHEFLGWYTEKEGGSKVSATTIMKQDSDHTLYAHWQEEVGVLQNFRAVLSSEIALHVHIDVTDDWLADNNTYVKFTLPDGSTQKVKFSEVMSTLETVNGKQCLLFKVSISAKDLTQKITAQVYSSTGKAEGKLNSFSVEDYVKVLGSSFGTDDDYYKVAKTMMTYGYYAQLYFNYKTDNLTEIKNTLQTVDFTEDVYEETKASGIRFEGAKLILGSTPGIKLYFETSKTLSASNVKNISSEKVSISKEDIFTVITITNISDVTKKFEIKKDSYNLKYSVYSYGECANKTSKTNLKNLMNALYGYYSMFE